MENISRTTSITAVSDITAVSGDADAPVRLRGSGTARRFALFGIFVLSLAATLLALSSLADDRGLTRYRPDLSEKLQLLHTTMPRPNVIFVGASVTLNGIIPDIVDKAAAEEGCAIHSVNLAVPAAQFFEVGFIIDEAMASGIPPGALIVYDVVSLSDAKFDDIHDSERKPIAARLKYAADLGQLMGKRDRRWLRSEARYVRAALSEALGINALHDMLFADYRPWERFNDELVASRGYVPAEAALATDAGRRDVRRKFLNPYRQLSFSYSLANWDPDKWSQEPRAANPFSRRIRAAGFRPVLFVPAYWVPSLAVAAMKAKQADPDIGIISITKATAPLIYSTPDYWFNQSHLMGKGAEIASGIAGRQVCALIKER